MRGWKQGDGLLAGQEAKIVLILFLTSGFAVFICLWLLVLPNSNNLINHALSRHIHLPDFLDFPACYIPITCSASPEWNR